ncbi:hypothetical protein M8J76_008545 [Diaphorina citri]|nr:hypothetical protein M8J76_008545 [Diaphorina citri]
MFSHQFLIIPSRKICHVFPSIPHYPIPQDLSCFPINSSLSHPARSVMFPSIPHYPIPQDLSCSHQFGSYDFYYAPTPTYKGEVVKGGESSPPKPSTPPILDTSYIKPPLKRQLPSHPCVPIKGGLLIPQTSNVPLKPLTSPPQPLFPMSLHPPQTSNIPLSLYSP